MKKTTLVATEKCRCGETWWTMAPWIVRGIVVMSVLNTILDLAILVVR